MKKFAGHRGVSALKALCAEKGVQIDTTKHDRDFSDFVRLDGVFDKTVVTMIYSVFNGTFFGETEQGVRFNESSPFDDEPWFTAILDLLYLPPEATHA